MDTIKVSVIIPVYNAEKYLRECLESVINQTLKEIEIICINDASTDASLDILKEFKKLDNRIIIINNEVNLGQGESRNLGIKLAKGKYLDFIDSDDYVDKEMLEICYKVAEENKADVVNFDSEWFDANTHKVLNRLTLPYFIKKKYKNGFNADMVSDCVFNVFHGFVGDKLIRRDLVIEKNILYSKFKHSEDIHFTFLVIALAQKIIHVNKIFYFYRTNLSDSVSSAQERTKNYECAYNTVESLREELKKHNLFFKFEKSFYKYAVSSFNWNLSTLPFEAANKLLNLINNDKTFDYSKNIFLEDKDYQINILENKIDKIKEFYDKIGNDKSIALWGAGKKGKAFLDVSQKEKLKVDYLIDKDSKKWGSKISGMIVKLWDEVKDKTDIIIVTNFSFYEEIKIYTGKKVFDMDSYLNFDASFEESID